MMPLRKNDKVKIITGKDKGKESSVIKVLSRQNKVLVKEVNVVTRHVKARKAGQTSAIKKEEGFIHSSNVMPICTACGKPTRIQVKQLDNKRVRICNRCKEQF